MSLQKLDNKWMSFGGGLKWRCVAPRYFCEVQNEGNVPVYPDKALMTKIREVRSFYSARMTGLGTLDASGYGVDILVANAFAESSGKVPSPLNRSDLERVYAAATGSNVAAKLDEVARYVRNNSSTKALVYFEPKYTNPVNTPNKVSMGSHHALVSTAAWLQGKGNNPTPETIVNLVQQMPSDSKFSAGLAVTYFNKSYSKHSNQPPLLAACYNAGSLRESKDNPWNLRCTNNHIDRWVKYFNMSRSAAVGAASQPKPTSTIGVPSSTVAPTIAKETILPAPSPKNVNTTTKLSVEKIISAVKAKNYPFRDADDKEYNLNIIGIRHNNARVNCFDDFLFVCWKFKGQWFSKQYNITTYPGKDYLGEKSVNRKGTAILKEGYYPGSHQVGFHKVSSPGRYEALAQRGNLAVYRDNNHDGKFDLRPETIDIGNNFGVNIHRGRAGGITVNVGLYSAGCQVFASYEQWVEFHNLFKKAEANWGKTFHYTLINANDLA